MYMYIPPLLLSTSFSRFTPKLDSTYISIDRKCSICFSRNNEQWVGLGGFYQDENHGQSLMADTQTLRVSDVKSWP